MFHKVHPHPPHSFIFLNICYQVLSRRLKLSRDTWLGCSFLFCLNFDEEKRTWREKWRVQLKKIKEADREWVEKDSTRLLERRRRKKSSQIEMVCVLCMRDRVCQRSYSQQSCLNQDKCQVALYSVSHTARSDSHPSFSLSLFPAKDNEPCLHPLSFPSLCSRWPGICCYPTVILIAGLRLLQCSASCVCECVCVCVAQWRTWNDMKMNWNCALVFTMPGYQ